MTRSLTELHAALQELADRAPTVDDLDHRAWRGTAASTTRPRRRRPVLMIVASATAVVAVVAVGAELLRGGNGSAPVADGTAALEVRPLVAPAVPLASSGARSADPLQALAFPVPTSEAGYDRLGGAQQQQLQAALATTDCAAQHASTAPTRVACGQGPPYAYLLGPSIFGTDDLADAQPVAPSLPGGSTQWAVALTLRPEAAAALQRYTTAHHAGNGVSADVTQCAGSSVPCADYAAFVVNGSAVSVPVTLAPLADHIQLSGNFTQDTATRLARELRP